MIIWFSEYTKKPKDEVQFITSNPDNQGRISCTFGIMQILIHVIIFNARKKYYGFERLLNSVLNLDGSIEDLSD